MMDVKHSHPDGVDTSSTNITDRDSTFLHSGTRPAETESSGVLQNNGATIEVEKTSQPDQANLLATRPNGGWKAWLQVACGFFLYFNTYGTAAVASKIIIRLCGLKVAD